MTPDEVIAELDKRGITISRSTLTRYEHAKKIPVPKRGAYGRGGGRWTDYPDETVDLAEKAFIENNQTITYWRKRALEAEEKLSNFIK